MSSKTISLIRYCGAFLLLHMSFSRRASSVLEDKLFMNKIQITWWCLSTSTAHLGLSHHDSLLGLLHWLQRSPGFYLATNTEAGENEARPCYSVQNPPIVPIWLSTKTNGPTESDLCSLSYLITCWFFF